MMIPSNFLCINFLFALDPTFCNSPFTVILCKLRLHHHEIHQEEVGDAPQQDEHMEDLVTAEAGVVPSRPLHRVQHPAQGVEQPAQHQPEHPLRGHVPQQAREHEHGHPPHDQVGPRRHPPRRVDPPQGHHRTGQGHPPHHRKHGEPPVLSEHQQADGRIGAGDEEIDGDMVIFPKGDAARYPHVQAVIERTGGI